jgi:hypothetical protein
VQALGSDDDLFYQGEPPTGRAPSGSDLDRMIGDELSSALRLLERLTS